MRIFPPTAFTRQPWKNGGGITHEITRATDAVGLLLWRLSIAEVGSEGPFSAFPGLARILTVIDGAGLHLDTPAGRLDALPFAPLGFAGDTPVCCRLIAGPVRDFNLIHDPARTRADVSVLEPGPVITCPAARGRRYALLATGPGCRLDGIDLPDGALTEFEQAFALAIRNRRALLVTIEHS